MTPSEKRAAAIKLLSELDQDAAEAAAIAEDSTNTRTMRLRALSYRNHFRQSIARTEKLLATLEADE